MVAPTYRLIEQALAPMIQQRGSAIAWDFDLAHDLPEIVSTDSFNDLVRSLVCESLECLPDGGEISLTACRSGDGWDLEVADSGPDMEERPCHPRWAAAKLGVRLQWMNCPQGGCAVVAHFTEQKAQQIKAA